MVSEQQTLMQIESANSFANWAFIGILIPVIGWVLASRSLSKLKPYKYDQPKKIALRMQIEDIRAKAYWAIIFSTLSAVIGFANIYAGAYGV